jgi:two-component sensor histidine kinase
VFLHKNVYFYEGKVFYDELIAIFMKTIFQLGLVIFYFSLSIQLTAQQTKEQILRAIQKEKPGTEAQGYLYIDLGNIAMDNLDKQALTYFETAQKIAEKIKNENLKSSALVSFAHFYAKQGNNIIAESFAKRAVEAAEVAQHPHFMFQANNALTDIYLDLGKMTEAKESLIVLKSLYENYYGKISVPDFYPILNGKYLLRSFKVNQAIENYLAGIVKAKAHNRDSLVYEMKTKLVQAYFMKGDVSSAMTEAQECMDYYTKSQENLGIANTNYSLGVGFLLINNAAKSIEYFDNAKAYYEKVNALPYLMNTYMSKANLLYRSARFYDALTEIENALILSKKVDNPSVIILANLYKSHIFYLAGDTISSANFRKIADTEASKLNNSDFKQLVYLSNFTKNKKLNIDSVNLILTNIEKGSVPVRIILAPVNNLANLTGNKGDLQQTLDSLVEKNTISKDSLQQKLMMFVPNSDFADSLNKIALSEEAKNKIPTLKEEIRKAVKEKKSSVKNQYILWAVLALCLIFSTALIFYVRKRNAQKREKMIHGALGTFRSIQTTIQQTLAQEVTPEILNTLNLKVKKSVDFFAIIEKSPKTAHISSNSVIEEMLNYFAEANVHKVSIDKTLIGKVMNKQLEPLLSILQELLLNTLKHAKSRINDQINITVVINTNDQTLLHYTDNGQGFEGNQPFRENSQGMAIIKAYAAKLNKTCTFENQNGFKFYLK